MWFLRAAHGRIGAGLDLRSGRRFGSTAQWWRDREAWLCSAHAPGLTGQWLGGGLDTGQDSTQALVERLLGLLADDRDMPDGVDLKSEGQEAAIGMVDRVLSARVDAASGALGGKPGSVGVGPGLLLGIARAGWLFW